MTQAASAALTHFALTHAALQDFAQVMARSTELKDGVLTARIIGEFSAGKTRLLRELLGDLIPPRLFPVSSIERQTKLQLEITYGETAELGLIERVEDYDPAIVVKTLDHFPERDELDESRYDPSTHRLRLIVPEARFILPEGDGYSDEKIPMRLFLIDTPGWNSGDDEIAESSACDIMAGYHNLALVYVSDARRLDSAANAGRLKEFLQVMADASFLGASRLLFVLTHCPMEDQARLKEKAHQLVLKLWEEIGYESAALSLTVFSVDFKLKEERSAQDSRLLQAFREEFWLQLLSPLGAQKTLGDPWQVAIRRWTDEADVRPRLAEAGAQLTVARSLLERARIENQFVKSMNMSRLMGLDDHALRAKVLQIWLRQIDFSSMAAVKSAFQIARPLPPDHPLDAWWKHYWLGSLSRTLKPLATFVETFEVALGSLNSTTEDLQEHFNARLGSCHTAAVAALESSFTLLVEVSQSLVSEPAQEKAVASLMTLSLLQSRYMDHYAAAQARYAPNVQ